MLKLVDWLPSFVLVAGILGWSSGALEDAVGIGMIGTGILGSVLIGRLSAASDSNV